METEQACPKCGSHELNVEGSWDAVNLEMQDDSKISALKFGLDQGQVAISCSECHSDLKLTVEGLKIKQ